MADAVPSEMQQGNPYVALLLRFAPEVGDPTPGYEARVILLGVIVGCIPLLATLLLVLHTITLRRKGEKLWLYKRVRRERGSYIVGARTPLLVILAYVVAATFAPALYYAWRFSVSVTAGAGQFQVCMFIFWALFYPTTYLFSLANLSAWLVLTSALSPRAALAIFGGLFVVCTLGLLGTAIFAIVCIFEFIAAAQPFFARLYAGAQSGATVISPDDLALVSHFAGLEQTYYDRLSNVLFTVSAAPAPVLIINFASLALVLAVRRQVIERNTGTLSYGERDINRKQLRAAEHALVVDSIFVAVWSGSLMIASTWAAIYLRTFTNVSFAGVEATLYVTQWVGSVPLVAALLAQVIIAWRNLPSARQPSNTESNFDAGGIQAGTFQSAPLTGDQNEKGTGKPRRGSILTDSILVSRSTQVEVELAEEEDA